MDPNADPTIFLDLEAEIRRARGKFPSNSHLIVALGEEYGEVCRAALDSETREDFRKECIQVACVALRLATEGDPAFPATLPTF